MCIKEIAAFEDSKGNMFKDERAALTSEIGIVTGFTPEDVLTVIGKASPLIPLLQRVLATATPTVKMTEKQLDEEGHHPSCRARATGYKSNCNCNGPGKGLSRDKEASAKERYESRAKLIGRIDAWAKLDKRKAVQFIGAGGYQDLPDINARATDDDIAKMHDELTKLAVL